MLPEIINIEIWFKAKPSAKMGRKATGL